MIVATVLAAVVGAAAARQGPPSIFRSSSSHRLLPVLEFVCSDSSCITDIFAVILSSNRSRRPSLILPNLHLLPITRRSGKNGRQFWSCDVMVFHVLQRLVTSWPVPGKQDECFTRSPLFSTRRRLHRRHLWSSAFVIDGHLHCCPVVVKMMISCDDVLKLGSFMEPSLVHQLGNLWHSVHY